MEPQAKAQLRYLHIAPRKTRAVVDVIRGLPVTEAEAQLLLLPRRAATPLLKLLRSATANAKQVMKKEADALFIKEIRVDQGPKSTRWMPRARGAMSPIERKTSHVSIILEALATPKASRFTVRKPVKKQTEEKKKRKPKPEAHEETHAREEKKEVEKKGFAQRFFRRKAV
ncbi:MAG: 50S ribosomal protein L22 [Candidatus Brennerbacteria bacterium]